ncbi:GNAT family N-acetyltransferase [Nonomuraea sp. NN258]|uniref:GNAT family N-acetyltransferase n=1 Tax=Nonomuraea antri TaxID=2730852 RepID=UPI00156A0A23|nr:GNAT family N-acetyltransferase [Nonomuraea antri]NRQ36314.1 GNAT family N-acetyltransferase [Nonomuraea antri]
MEIEIRRVRESEGEKVGDLWNRMCAELDDGGPLGAEGQRNLSRMLGMSAWHRDAFCLVAVADEEIVGFVNGRLDDGDGLLPGLLGEIDELYVVPEHRGRGVSRALARAAADWLFGRGALTVRHLACRDNTEAHRFWEGVGFQNDLVCLSLYRED